MTFMIPFFRGALENSRMTINSRRGCRCFFCPTYVEWDGGGGGGDGGVIGGSTHSIPKCCVYSN